MDSVAVLPGIQRPRARMTYPAVRTCPRCPAASPGRSWMDLCECGQRRSRHADLHHDGVSLAPGVTCYGRNLAGACMDCAACSVFQPAQEPTRPATEERYSAAPARRVRYNPALQRHSWTKLQEHHKECWFCGLHVVNEHTSDRRTWWQTWTWPDGQTGSNQGGPAAMPKCPGPPGQAV